MGDAFRCVMLDLPGRNAAAVFDMFIGKFILRSSKT